MLGINWNRRSERHQINRSGALRCRDGWRSVQVMDASENGLGLRGLGLPSQGEYVEVSLGSHLVVGKVAWSSGARCGVSTQQFLDVSRLEQEGEERCPQRVGRVPVRSFPASANEGEARRVAKRRSRPRLKLAGLVAAGLAVLACAALASVGSSALVGPLHAAEVGED